jgi:hypothetical protein
VFKHCACGLGLLAGVWLIPAGSAQEPTRIHVGQTLPSLSEPSLNQQTADAIVAHLRQSGQLKGYSIDVRVANGTAVLTGRVADQPQKEEVLRIVQGVPGVERVRDQLLLASEAEAAPMMPAAMMPSPPPLMGMPMVPMQAPFMGQPPPPMPGAEAAVAGLGFNEPVPIYQAGVVPPYAAVNPPAMPPYAWPTYAPYNNFSRVAYPTAYPYNAWPFIGPCYPFPKIPLSWRSVKLQWQDGYWWFSKTATKHDWWRLRYW